MTRSLMLVVLACGGLLPADAMAQLGSPAGAVPPERLAARRAALLERLGEGIAVLRGTSERSIDPPNSDYPQDSDFRQDNDIFYLTGLEVPEAWLVLVARTAGPDEVLLFLPPRQPARERWLGERLGPGPEAAAAAGLAPSAVFSATDALNRIEQLLRSADSPARTGALFLARTRRAEADAALRQLTAAAPRMSDLRPHLAALRLIKDEEEIRRLRRAVEISVDGHLAAWRATRPGAWEYELEAAAEGTFRRLGAERLGYPSIVGTGRNSTVLHYDDSRAQLRDGEVVVMDMGAEFGYYTADLTRTVPVSGRFTERQRALYPLVLGAQQIVLDSLRPGVTWGRLTALARGYLRDHSDDLCAPRTCDAFFVHGLGHHIGMDVHDVGGFEAPLAPGMVITIEPGVYLPDEGLGIRIEDDLLITPTGAELLSTRLPRAPEAIETFLAAARESAVPRR
jgi:Xaa-Pro aminopeptidase